MAYPVNNTTIPSPYELPDAISEQDCEAHPFRANEPKAPKGLHARSSRGNNLPKKKPGPRYIETSSNAIFSEVRKALSLGSFEQTEESDWPIVQLKKGKTVGHAELVPLGYDCSKPAPVEVKTELVQQMFRHAAALSDCDADILDLSIAVWLAQASTPDQSADVRVDDLLAMRGLRAKRGAGGRPSGFRPVQRASIQQSLQRIESIWITVERTEVYQAKTGERRATRHPMSAQSRALVVTDRIVRDLGNGYTDLLSFRFHPGSIFSQFLFGPGRQVGLLAAKVAQYHPIRRRWEKRLARYLSWIWRIRANSGTFLEPFKVGTLLAQVGRQSVGLNSSKIRDRFERALNNLEADGIIKAWQYEGIGDKDGINHSGWFETWLNQKIVVEPAAVVSVQYGPIGRKGRRKLTPVSPSIGHGHRVLTKRLKLRISQLYAAEQIGIRANLLCMIEKGSRLPSQNVKRKIDRWLEDSQRDIHRIPGTGTNSQSSIVHTLVARP